METFRKEPYEEYWEIFFLEELQVTSFVKFMKRYMLELQMESQEKHEGYLVHTSLNSKMNIKKIHIFKAFLRGISGNIPKEILERSPE